MMIVAFLCDNFFLFNFFFFFFTFIIYLFITRMLFYDAEFAFFSNAKKSSNTIYHNNSTSTNSL